jgi:uncharacterized coiled-coil protein SlyX
MSRKTDLLDIINDPAVSEVIKDDARQQIKELEIAEAGQNPSVDADINFAITELKKALEQSRTGGEYICKRLDFYYSNHSSCKLAGCQSYA